jgi:HEAT repeat protein
MPLMRSLNRLFNIQTAEWPRLLFLYAMVFLFILGITWGGLSVEAAFLIEVGVENLPHVIIANALVSIAAVAVYTPFVDRVANDRLLIYVILACAIPIGAGSLLLQTGRPAITNLAYQMLYLLTIVIRQVFNLQWWTYVNSFYDTRAAKRIIPVLITAPRFAIIIAGQTMGLLHTVMISQNIIWLWMFTLLLVAFLVWLMPRLLKAQQAQSASQKPTRSTRQSFLHNVREGCRDVFQAPYLRWMALSTLLLMILLALLEFRASWIFTRPGNFASPEALSAFLGRLSSWTSLILLPFQLFLFSRLVAKIGLGNANLIFPASALATGAALIARPGIATASLAYVDRIILFRVFRNPINNMLYNAVPLRIKGRARAFIDGLVAPVGSLLGGLSLLIAFGAADWFLPTLIGTAALTYAAASVILRRQYTQALVALLEREDFSALFASAPADLRVTDPTALTWLTQKLRESADSDLTIFMAQLVGEVGGTRATPALTEALRAADEAPVRAAIIDVLASNDVRTGDAARLYTDCLDDPDGRVRRAALTALERWAGPDSERFLTSALDLLDDPDIDVRAQAIPALVQAGDFFYMASAVQALTQLLEDDDPERRARGVRVLGQIGDVRFIRNLAPNLADEDDHVRLQAALAIESLSRDGMPAPVVQAIMAYAPPLLHDPIERVRLAAIAILAHIDAPQARRLLVDLLTDASPHVREAAVEALVRIGQPITPLLTPALQAPAPRLRTMSAIALSRIDREQFGNHVVARLDETLHAIYLNLCYAEALTPYAERASVSVLQSVLAERNTRSIQEIFHLLAAIHDPEAIDVIADTLASDVGRVRANAVEALESLTGPQTARLIAPLLDPHCRPADLRRTGEETWGMARCGQTETIRRLVGDPNDPWVRGIMTFALGEIGAALASSQEGTTDDSDTLSMADIKVWVEKGLDDPVDDVRLAAEAAQWTLSCLETGISGIETEQAARKWCATEEEDRMLSNIERIIFLKGVPFFQGMSIDHLKVIANVCEEVFFPQGDLIFNEGESGGAMYVVVSGRVAIERPTGVQRTGSLVRLATIEPRAYFGEMSLFDRSPRSAIARAIQDTISLHVRREPLVELARQHPDLSLELIHVLSQRLRAANDRIAELTRAKPRELHDLYDKIL